MSTDVKQQINQNNTLDFKLGPEKKEEIWLSPMTKAPTPTENSKSQMTTQKLPLHNDCGPT